MITRVIFWRFLIGAQPYSIYYWCRISSVPHRERMRQTHVPREFRCIQWSPSKDDRIPAHVSLLMSWAASAWDEYPVAGPSPPQGMLYVNMCRPINQASCQATTLEDRVQASGPPHTCLRGLSTVYTYFRLCIVYLYWRFRGSLLTLATWDSLLYSLHIQEALYNLHVLGIRYSLHIIGTLNVHTTQTWDSLRSTHN